ncbi:MAG: 3D domain-containing protein [Planctomycetes bacterium]|nr:3D domain-containing protein [Planctomycetota bacterium]
MSDPAYVAAGTFKKILLWLWWGGSTRPGPMWLAVGCLGVGFLGGIFFDMRFREVEVIERVRTYIFGEKSLELPKPVTAPPPGKEWVKALTTAYCPCVICCEKVQQDWKTAINRDVRANPYGIASAHQLVPPRIWLDIPGYGHAMVDDTGGAMRQDAKRGIVHLDLRYEDHQVARRWGRRWMWIALPEDCGAAKLPPEPTSLPSP